MCGCDNVIPNEIGFVDSDNIDSEITMDSTDTFTEETVYDEKEVEEKLSSLRQQLKDVQEQLNVSEAIVKSLKDTHKKEMEKLEAKICWLEEKLEETNKLLQTREVEHQAQVDELQAEVKTLQTEVDQLKHKVNVSECDQGKLYLSQVAAEFERAICSHVLPEVYSNNRNLSNANIISLVNMLNGDIGYLRIRLNRKRYKESDIKEIRRRAKSKWTRLCDDLHFPRRWKSITGKEIDYSHGSVPDIFRTTDLLKRQRNPVAHPIPVNLQVAKKIFDTTSIKEDLDDDELELIKKFLSSGLQGCIEEADIKTDKKRLII